MLTIHKPDKPKYEDLRRVYDVCNKIFKTDKLFYTKEQVHKLKQDNSYIFLKNE